jgi:hypothetical protein
LATGCSTVAVNEIRTKSQTPRFQRDAYVRTSVFDAHLAKELTNVPGYTAAFAAHRDDPALPNVTFSFDGGAEHR